MLDFKVKFAVEGHFNPGLFNPIHLKEDISTPVISKSPGLRSLGLKSSWLKSLGLKSPGLESSWLKSLGLKGLGLKLGVEKSGVEMSFNRVCVFQ